MSWMVVVLLPKGGGDFKEIGLLNLSEKWWRKSWYATWLPSNFIHASMEDRTPKVRDGISNN
jgi:hypothetical protein